MNDIVLIKDKLIFFQEAYKKRNIDDIDFFLDKMFGVTNNATIIGTSDGELCFNKEKIRKLFVSDWQYWGDLNIDIESSVIRQYKETAWVHIPATVKHSFSDDDKTFKNFVGFVKEFFDGESPDSHKDIRIKLTEINWFLAHLLYQREPILKREYFWQMRLFMVFEKINSGWFVQHIQFSFPQNSIFSDERFSEYNSYEKSYLREQEIYRTHSNYEYLGEKEKKFLADFSAQFRVKNSEFKSNIDTMFSNRSMLVSTDSKVLIGGKAICEKLININQDCDVICLNIETSIHRRRENCIWLHTNGFMKKNMTEKELYVHAEKDIKSILMSNRADKEKLFYIRRNISRLLYEQSYGSDYTFPLRFDCFLSTEKDLVKIDYLQFSLPSNIILEQIND